MYCIVVYTFFNPSEYSCQFNSFKNVNKIRSRDRQWLSEDLGTLGREATILLLTNRILGLIDGLVYVGT